MDAWSGAAAGAIAFVPQLVAEKIMTSREAILQRIRSGLTNAAAAGFGDVREPPVPEVWPRTSRVPSELLAQFSEELNLLKGEPLHFATIDVARQQLSQIMEAGGWSRLGCLDRPLLRDLTGQIAAERIDWVSKDWMAEQIEKLPAALITAEALLADTGSCVVHCATAAERLMCYLPPVCIVAAGASQIAEHLPAAWPPIAAACRAPESRGEVVLITGPSRTADIEKKLILGVHGPKRLIVLIVE
jgi:L-lactate dehydrogenase complex protein LldG